MVRHLVALMSICILASPSAALAQAKARKPAKKQTQAVELQTSMGTIQLELFADKAPKTVESFIKYVKSGHYNGTIFHRVIAGFMIQGGGFDARYKQKPTRLPIANEANNGLSNERGTVAMARTSDPHSASAQFFINLVKNKMLDHSSKTRDGWGYCVFGKVIKGMEVVDKIKAVPTGARGPFAQDAPLKEVVIKKARLL